MLRDLKSSFLFFSRNSTKKPGKIREESHQRPEFKGTVSPDYKCLEVISIKSPLLGHVTPDI